MKLGARYRAGGWYAPPGPTGHPSCRPPDTAAVARHRMILRVRSQALMDAADGAHAQSRRPRDKRPHPLWIRARERRCDGGTGRTAPLRRNAPAPGRQRMRKGLAAVQVPRIPPAAAALRR